MAQQGEPTVEDLADRITQGGVGVAGVAVPSAYGRWLHRNWGNVYSPDIANRRNALINASRPLNALNNTRAAHYKRCTGADEGINGQIYNHNHNAFLAGRRCCSLFQNGQIGRTIHGINDGPNGSSGGYCWNNGNTTNMGDADFPGPEAPLIQRILTGDEWGTDGVDYNVVQTIETINNQRQPVTVDIIGGDSGIPLGPAFVALDVADMIRPIELLISRINCIGDTQQNAVLHNGECSLRDQGLEHNTYRNRTTEETYGQECYRFIYANPGGLVNRLAVLYGLQGPAQIQAIRQLRVFLMRAYRKLFLIVHNTAGQRYTRRTILKKVRDVTKRFCNELGVEHADVNMGLSTNVEHTTLGGRRILRRKGKKTRRKRKRKKTKRRRRKRRRKTRRR
jgi:hypothetical protein